MASNASFAATPRVSFAALTTANTAKDGSGSTVSLFAAGSLGSRVERVTAKGTATLVAGSIMLFITDGTSTRAYREMPVIATTSSTTAPTFESQLQIGIVLPAGYSLLATTTITQSIHLTTEGADF